MTDAGGFVEVQGTAEREPFTRAQLDAMLRLGEQGIRELFALQLSTLRQAQGDLVAGAAPGG